MNEPNDENLHFLDYWRVVQSRKELVVAVFLVVVLAGVLVTFTRPRVYMASTVVAVREERPDVAVFSRESQHRQYDPFFLRTQFEIIQSAPVIEETVRRTGLAERWAVAYGYDTLPPDQIMMRTARLLERRIKVQQFRDTNLIEINVYMDEPQASVHRDVAEIANTIAVVYRAQSMRRNREQVETALKALQATLDEHNARVAEAEDLVDSIRQEYSIDIVPFAGTGGSLEKLGLAQLEGQFVQLRIELEGKRALFESVQGLSQELLVDAAPYIVGDPALSALVDSKRRAEIEMSRLNEMALGPNHPDVVRVRATVNELSAKIQEALRGLRTGVEAEYKAAQAKYNAIAAMIEERRSLERMREGTGYRKFEQARDELARLKRIRDALEMRHLQERIELRIPRTTVDIIEEARPANLDAPVSPNIVMNIMLSVMLGLLGGFGMAFFVEYLDTSLKTVDDIEKHMGVSVIGAIPQRVKPMNAEAGQHAAAEAYRMLRANLQISSRGKDARALAVTSGSVGEGKSLTAFNLAWICSTMGDKVVLVDADLHRPRQGEMAGFSNEGGLSDVLRGECNIDDVVKKIDGGPDLLLSGSSKRTLHGALEGHRIRDTIAELKRRYDMVIVDTPPVMGVSDTALLVRETDGVILVIQHLRYPRMVSKRAKLLLQNLGVNLLGVVLNCINLNRDYAYYYDYGYNYSKPSQGKKNQ